MNGWGFVTLYETDDGHPDPGRAVADEDDHPKIDGWLDHVGIVTLRGTRLPLTKDLVARMTEPAWIKGRLASLLWIPYELENLGPHEPLPSVEVHVRAGYTTGQTIVDPEKEPSRVSFTSRLDPDDCCHQHLVMLMRSRLEGWPS